MTTDQQSQRVLQKTDAKVDQSHKVHGTQDPSQKNEFNSVAQGFFDLQTKNGVMFCEKLRPQFGENA